MKKVLILSDTHRDIKLIDEVLAKESFDVLIHLGDHHDDIEEFLLPDDVKVFKVKGNCDFYPEEDERVIEIEGVKNLITHGHHYNVKYFLDTLEGRGEEVGAELILFGHTHIKKDYVTDAGIRMFNPGSLCYYRSYGQPSYGFMEVDNGKILSLNHRTV